MIIERIDEKKLMIMLEEQDMSSLELTYDKVSWKNHRFKLLVAKLLALAKFKTGFSVDDSKLSIETMPQGSGCVIIFTLSPELKTKSQDTNTALVTYKKENLKPYIYKFDNIDNLLEARSKIAKTEKSAVLSNKIFSLENVYYILLQPVGEVLPKSISVLLNEYGSEIDYDRVFESYLYEFGKVLHDAPQMVLVGDNFSK